MSMEPIGPITNTRTFKLGKDTIVVKVSNIPHHFRWQMVVNGKTSDWPAYYQGILIHEGYGLVTGYFADKLQEFVPFKIQHAEEVK